MKNTVSSTFISSLSRAVSFPFLGIGVKSPMQKNDGTTPCVKIICIKRARWYLSCISPLVKCIALTLSIPQEAFQLKRLKLRSITERETIKPVGELCFKNFSSCSSYFFSNCHLGQITDMYKGQTIQTVENSLESWCYEKELLNGELFSTVDLRHF